MPRFLPWLDQRQPDIVCLQELKVTTDWFWNFLGDELESRGYKFAVNAQPQWNGVALDLQGRDSDDVVVGLPEVARLSGRRGACDLGMCGGIRVHSLYVPNGRVPDSDHYKYKLEWLNALRDDVKAGPENALVCGDMNIAPTDADVFNPKAFIGQTHVTEPERNALARTACARPSGRRPRALAQRARVQLLGLPCRNVPQEPRHANRPDSREFASRRTGSSCVDRS